MSLKRKASFPTIAAVTPFCPEAVVVDDTPRHLNSRTRKRFRNDRPDDQTVYENTLRLLFSAQKERVSSSPSSLDDESVSPSSPPSEPEPIDPRQQSLRKYFKPAKASSSSIRTDCQAQNKGNNPSMDVGCGSPMDSGSETSLSGEMKMDVEMDTDCAGRDSSPDAQKWIGGIGWM